MALFVGSVVFQLFEKALGRIFVICLKQLPYPCVCMGLHVVKNEEKIVKKTQTALCWCFAAADFFCVLENTCI